MPVKCEKRIRVDVAARAYARNDEIYRFISVRAREQCDKFSNFAERNANRVRARIIRFEKIEPNLIMLQARRQIDAFDLAFRIFFF